MDITHNEIYDKLRSTGHMNKEGCCDIADLVLELVKPLQDRLTSVESELKKVSDPVYWYKNYVDLESERDQLRAQVAEQTTPAESVQVVATASRNRYGLDANYFSGKLQLILRDLDNYKPDEMARSLARLTLVADEKVLQEPEFSSKVEQVSGGSDEYRNTLNKALEYYLNTHNASAFKMAEIISLCKLPLSVQPSPNKADVLEDDFDNFNDNHHSAYECDGDSLPPLKGESI